MAATKLTWDDKVQGQVNPEPITKKLTFGEVNELRDAFNSHADDIDANTTAASNAQSAADANTTNKISKNEGATYTTNALTTVTQAEYDALTPDANTLYFIV